MESWVLFLPFYLHGHPLKAATVALPTPVDACHYGKHLQGSYRKTITPLKCPGFFSADSSVSWKNLQICRPDWLSIEKMRMLLRRSEIYQKCIISSRPSPPSRWPWYRRNGSCWQSCASGRWMTDSWKHTRFQTLRKISPTARNTAATSRHFAWENSKPFIDEGVCGDFYRQLVLVHVFLDLGSGRSDIC